MTRYPLMQDGPLLLRERAKASGMCGEGWMSRGLFRIQGAINTAETLAIQRFVQDENAAVVQSAKRNDQPFLSGLAARCLPLSEPEVSDPETNQQVG